MICCLVRRALRDAGRAQDQPARRRIDLRVCAQQIERRELLQRADGIIQCGNFFGPDLEKKIHACLIHPSLRRPYRQIADPLDHPTRSVTEIAPRASSRLNRCEHFSTCSYAGITGKRFFSGDFSS